MQNYVVGQVVKHKLGFGVVVTEIKPLGLDLVRGKYLENGVLKEVLFQWQELE